MKKLLLLFFAVFCLGISAQEKQGFQLSTHILDISLGLTANNVEVQLEKYNERSKQWFVIDKKKTDSNGRIKEFLPYQKNTESNNGKYKLVFFTEPYYKNKNIESFYPFIEVIFQIKDQEHYHVPITLSPFGYSTYRGS